MYVCMCVCVYITYYCYYYYTDRVSLYSEKQLPRRSPRPRGANTEHPARLSHTGARTHTPPTPMVYIIVLWYPFIDIIIPEYSPTVVKGDSRVPVSRASRAAQSVYETSLRDSNTLLQYCITDGIMQMRYIGIYTCI
jgi:hypothetical protein